VEEGLSAERLVGVAVVAQERDGPVAAVESEVLLEPALGSRALRPLSQNENCC